MRSDTRDVKRCKDCGVLKEAHCFFANTLTKDGLMNPCKECRKVQAARDYRRRRQSPAWIEKQKESLRSWETRNPDKKRAKARRNYTTAKGRKYNLWFNYKITPEDYERIFQAQSGRCALCKRAENECATAKQHRLFVDHNHANGNVRGLLCIRCNAMIGVIEKARPIKDQIEKYLSNDGAEYRIEESTSPGDGS